MVAICRRKCHENLRETEKKSSLEPSFTRRQTFHFVKSWQLVPALALSSAIRFARVGEVEEQNEQKKKKEGEERKRRRKSKKPW